MSKVLGVASLVTKNKKTLIECDKEFFLKGIAALRVNYSTVNTTHYLDGSVIANLTGGVDMLDLYTIFKAKK